MEIIEIKDEFSICKVNSLSSVSLDAQYCFLSKTTEEISLTCLTKDVPENALEKDDGWRGLYLKGTLDFSLVGILGKITKALWNNKIPLFVISTYNTDYIFVKKENFSRAKQLIEKI